MNTNNKPHHIWTPLAIAFSVVIGIIVGNQFANQRTTSVYDRKLNTILNMVADNYVDTITINDLIERSIPEILSNLDPHTTYFTAQDLKQANEELNGSFSGIGISFQIINDTVSVIEVIPGGPAEKVGILAGDRIVSVNDTSFVNTKISSNQVKEKLRGEKDSIVKLGVKRATSHKTLFFNVKRGDIPVKSVDAAYIIDDKTKTGYVKVNQFGRTTYDEFITALSQLKQNGADKFIIDLRGNGGGYMEMAVLMVNEFLPSDRLIVYTHGREKRDDSQIWSDGNGTFINNEVVVLIDEFSASASEIFAGAIQDNDRGLIIGCRSFGKGLVQRQMLLPDSSAIRMTIARYYTPSGRCIQKDYTKGGKAYEQEILGRYSNGELFSRDSIKVDNDKIFTTSHGRRVYGGGGIIPDIFVPKDTTGISSYYIAVINAGLIQQFAFKYVDINRKALASLTDYKHFLRRLPSDDSLLNDFVNFAADKGVPARWYYINISRHVLLSEIKALIARDIFGIDAYYPILNKYDSTVNEAIKAIRKHKSEFPITEL